MTQEHRVLLAALLSSLIMVWYLQTFGKPRQVDLPVQKDFASAVEQRELAHIQPTQVEEVIHLESQHIELEIGKDSASIRKATLKGYQHLTTHNALQFGESYPILLIQVGDSKEAWNLQRASPREATWTRQHNGTIHGVNISLNESGPTFSIEISAENNTSTSQQLATKLIASFGRSDEMNGRNNQLEATLLTEKQIPWQRAYLKYFGSRSMTNVPRGTLMATLAERYFCHSIRPSSGLVTTAVLPSNTNYLSVSIESSVAVDPGQKETIRSTSYLGPRDFFKLRDSGFAEAFPVGLLTKIGLALMLFMKWIASLTNSYGIAVILLALIVTLCMSPFTLVSFRSMRKMHELQPKLEALKKKYAKDPKRVNQETFLLFKEHRVSPLSGCLPMLIQMPIFFSIWSAISHVIELRGQPFLWIKDLSLPDRLARIPPGLDLNILPIFMAAAMFFQTKLSQQQVPQSGTNDMAKMMSGPLMPLMFGVMFYGLPSYLVLYWLTNSLTTLAFYQLAKT